MNQLERFRKTVAAMAVVVALLIAFARTAVTVSGFGQPATSTPTIEQSLPQTDKPPQTAAEHLAMAESYRKKAAEYRAEAEFHHKMLADYKKRVPQTKEVIENSYVKKMRLHCEHYITAAESLAREAEWMAEFHTFRAKEMQGNEPRPKQ
ncbi:MAG: hypothetical protein HY774_20375 [Acidobacteria bacterium]|nr:hypothetical protein [Acidobacteriota bacterium]